MSKTLRRVYMLPPELHESIKSFCTREEISETEGVRRLLSYSLDKFEDADHFEQRVRRMRPVDAAFAAFGHPLVRHVGGDEAHAIIILRNGTTIEVRK